MTVYGEFSGPPTDQSQARPQPSAKLSRCNACCAISRSTRADEVVALTCLLACCKAMSLLELRQSSSFNVRACAGGPVRQGLRTTAAIGAGLKIRPRSYVPRVSVHIQHCCWHASLQHSTHSTTCAIVPQVFRVMYTPCDQSSWRCRHPEVQLVVPFGHQQRRFSLENLAEIHSLVEPAHIAQHDDLGGRRQLGHRVCEGVPLAVSRSVCDALLPNVCKCHAVLPDILKCVRDLAESAECHHLQGPVMAHHIAAVCSCSTCRKCDTPSRAPTRSQSWTRWRCMRTGRPRSSTSLWGQVCRNPQCAMP